MVSIRDRARGKSVDAFCDRDSARSRDLGAAEESQPAAVPAVTTPMTSCYQLSPIMGISDMTLRGLPQRAEKTRTSGLPIPVREKRAPSDRAVSGTKVTNSSASSRASNEAVSRNDERVVASSGKVLSRSKVAALIMWNGTRTTERDSPGLANSARHV